MRYYGIDRICQHDDRQFQKSSDQNFSEGNWTAQVSQLWNDQMVLLRSQRIHPHSSNKRSDPNFSDINVSIENASSYGLRVHNEIYTVTSFDQNGFLINWIPIILQLKYLPIFLMYPKFKWYRFKSTFQAMFLKVWFCTSGISASPVTSLWSQKCPRPVCYITAA